MKTHAKDYLKEFAASQKGWMKIVIQEVIDTNGNISQERLDQIFESFIQETSIPVTTTTAPSKNEAKQKILLKTLKHVCGVGALSENQEIKFSDNVTVLYGLNGSGKSSYFRILNELCGGNQKKEILQNIYEDSSELKPIKVSGSYKIGNTTNPITDWNPQTGAVPDLQPIKVFDSSYLIGLLSPRTPDETVVTPLGIHLFSYLTKVLDEYSKKVSQLIEKEKNNIPVINTDDLQEEYKTIFNNHSKFSPSQIQTISNLYTYTETEEKSLLKYVHDVNDLQQINYDDKIKLLTQRNSSYSDFVSKAKSISNNLSEYQKELVQKLESLSLAKAKNEMAIQNSKILRTLPKSDSNEWKAFIHAGHEYSKIIEPTAPKKCPYCHQELKTDESLSIVQAYANFLNDTSEIELKSAIKELKEIREKIKNLDVSIAISDELKDCLKDFSNIDSKINSFKIAKQTLLDAELSDEVKISIPDLKCELEKINSEIKANNEKISELKIDDSNKEKRIIQLNESISNLKQKKAISKQKDAINRYFSIFAKIDTLLTKQSQFRTTEITKLANQANKELLTSSLEQKLANELNNLGRNDLKVILQTTNGGKGKCNTQLILKGNHRITDILGILSEGEQKAVGLAVFFAEIQDENVPIILDDPVTSLDHEIAAKLAKRLLDMNNQVIVFCHNRLFLDGFETSRENHVCKTNQSCCDSKGKHILIYRVYGDNKEKGILSNYRGETSEALIREAERKLNKRPFDENYSVAILLRRAVEKIIDEKVYRYQLPPRVSNKNSRFNWDELKAINPKPALLDKLKAVHNAVSEENHDGTSSLENPMTIDELKRQVDELKAIKMEFDT